MSKNKKHLVIGKGEVGAALFTLLKKRYDVSIRDKNEVLEGEFDVIHITYPSMRDFVGVTKRYIKKYKPKLAIIHSTVPVGTTKKIGALAVHSPIRGMHTKNHHPGFKKSRPLRGTNGDPEYFARSMKVFEKYFGGYKAKQAAKIFSNIGIKVKTFKKPETTELLKILDTTYYGWNIIFAKEVKRICDKLNLDFDEVYTIPNRDYNESYKKLGKPHVVRPVLKYMPGKIGGHCVTQNTELLKDWLTDTLKDRNKKY